MLIDNQPKVFCGKIPNSVWFRTPNGFLSVLSFIRMTALAYNGETMTKEAEQLLNLTKHLDIGMRGVPVGTYRDIFCHSKRRCPLLWLPYC